jgi:hypothetical protein
MSDNGIHGKLLWMHPCGNEAHNYPVGSRRFAAGEKQAGLIQDNFDFVQDIFGAGAWKESLHPSEPAS